MLVLIPVNHEERKKVHDPLHELVTHVIKQAVDDYREGREMFDKARPKWKLPARYGNRQIRREEITMEDAQDGKDFIYGDRLIRYLRILNMDHLINIQYFQSKAEEPMSRKFNSIQ